MKGTDNSNFEKKVLLRIAALKEARNNVVLDCYAGTGRLWREVQRRTGIELKITSIEKEKGKNPTALCGDNMKILPSLDIDRYGLIDLDSYGHPVAQLRHIAARGYSGVVCVTWIDTVMAQQPREVVSAIGVDYEIYRKHPVIFNSLKDRLFKNFLYICGAKQLIGWFAEDKKYFYYKPTKNNSYEQNL
jgi:hypothetical protein